MASQMSTDDHGFVPNVDHLVVDNATYAERFDDADFRSHFSRLAEESLGRVETVLERLEQLAA